MKPKSAEEILEETRGRNKIGTAWQVTHPIIIEAMESFAKQRAIDFFRWYFKECTEEEYLNAVSSPTFEDTYDMFMKSYKKNL